MVVISYAFAEAHKELDGLGQDAAKELDCIDALVQCGIGRYAHGQLSTPSALVGN